MKIPLERLQELAKNPLFCRKSLQL